MTLPISETEYRIGSAQRNAKGEVTHWATGRSCYTLAEARAYIANLRASYEARDAKLPWDEFVPVEITTTYHDPVE
jgi:hypothetical protein